MEETKKSFSELVDEPVEVEQEVVSDAVELPKEDTEVAVEPEDKETDAPVAEGAPEVTEQDEVVTEETTEAPESSEVIEEDTTEVVEKSANQDDQAEDDTKDPEESDKEDSEDEDSDDEAEDNKDEDIKKSFEAGREAGFSESQSIVDELKSRVSELEAQLVVKKSAEEVPAEEATPVEVETPVVDESVAVEEAPVVEPEAPAEPEVAEQEVADDADNDLSTESKAITEAPAEDASTTDVDGEEVNFVARGDNEPADEPEEAEAPEEEPAEDVASREEQEAKVKAFVEGADERFLQIAGKLSMNDRQEYTRSLMKLRGGSGSSADIDVITKISGRVK